MPIIGNVREGPNADLVTLPYFTGPIRFTQTGPHDAGSGAQSQSGPNDDEPVSLKGSGYSTDNTKAVAINASTAATAANSPKLKDSLGDFAGLQRNLGVGLFISCGANGAKAE